MNMSCEQLKKKSIDVLEAAAPEQTNTVNCVNCDFKANAEN